MPWVCENELYFGMYCNRTRLIVIAFWCTRAPLSEICLSGYTGSNKDGGLSCPYLFR